MMETSLLHGVVVVLYESQDQINIGAVVRAMKNMGVRDLRLVRPCSYDQTRIEQVAHDTRDVVDRIRHFDSLDEALADCVYVVAYSGRRRAAKWTRHTPRSAAPVLLEYAATGTVAVMFGREDHGLPNEALDRAHALVTIPTTEHFSLNVAQACLVALYELHLAAGDASKRIDPPKHVTPPPTSDALEQTFRDARQALAAIDFFGTRNGELVMRSLRSLVLRAAPDHRELMLLRTASIEVVRTIERESRKAAAQALRDHAAVASESSPTMRSDPP